MVAAQKFFYFFCSLGSEGLLKTHLKRSIEVACRAVLLDYIAILGVDRHQKVALLLAFQNQ
jgi:hypothetical protein